MAQNLEWHQIALVCLYLQQRLILTFNRHGSQAGLQLEILPPS